VNLAAASGPCLTGESRHGPASAAFLLETLPLVKDWKRGDCVRATCRHSGKAFQPSDKGIIGSVPKDSSDGTLRYDHEAVDGQDPDATTAIFTEDESAPDE
jgi:hypothetical protein